MCKNFHLTEVADSLVIYSELALQVEVKNSTRPVDDIPTFVEDSTGPVCDTPREYAGSATNVPSVKRHAQTINRKVTQEAIVSQQAKVFLNFTLAYLLKQHDLRYPKLFPTVLDIPVLDWYHLLFLSHWGMYNERYTFCDTK